uniref:Large ribosomal subunit protein mL49 n=1 Tax=Glossina austeni TaxID=7395 RepID=A0A1A9VQA0_GLOAU
MLPVYLKQTFRGQRRVTVIRRIQGNLWELEREIRELVEGARNGRVCATRVNEMSGQVHIHGDYKRIFEIKRSLSDSQAVIDGKADSRLKTFHYLKYLKASLTDTPTCYKRGQKLYKCNL